MISSNCSGTLFRFEYTLPGGTISSAWQGQNPINMANEIITNSKMLSELEQKAAESCLCAKRNCAEEHFFPTD